MTDDQLAGLFAEGSAPERDAAFARHVGIRIGRARRGQRLLVLAMRALVILMLAATLSVTIRALEPVLAPLTEELPHFMGVPVPLILVVLAIGLAIRFRRFARLAFLARRENG